jgi:geranylgeranyl diphosphate synthase type II
MGGHTTTTTRIEQALQGAVNRATHPGAPPKLAGALHAAVFPGGARVRPQLCLAVSGACGDGAPSVADGAAAAIELLHCASLVHDDLPCFDDAALRRGKPSIHRAFGEPIAVLTGDALIVLAFETVARACVADAHLAPPLMATLGRASGSPRGLAAGQAWESETDPVLEDYHRAKTGALFVAATVCGATAAGADPTPWRPLGERLGEAYQVADDLRDVASDSEELGKPTLRDAVLLRPNAVTELGLDGALTRLKGLLEDAADAVPECAGAASLRELVVTQAKRLIPKSLAQTAA